MEHWKELLYKESITDEELKRITGSSCENYITAKNYFIQQKGFTEAQLLEGLTVGPEYFNNPRNWLSAYDERVFNLNVFRNAREPLTHHDYVDAGIHFLNLENSFMKLFFRTVPISTIFREIRRNVKKFNNEYRIDYQKEPTGEWYFKIDDFPYYKHASLGNECRFTEGVILANLLIHDVKDYDHSHEICGKRIENLIEHTYAHLGLQYAYRDNQLFINDEYVGRKVHLRKVQRGKEYWFTHEIDELNFDYNAVLIEKNVLKNGRALFKAGEIYNAPYCVVQVKWINPSLFTRIKNVIAPPDSVHAYLQELDRQVEFGNQKLFELRQALEESERRLRIAEVYTRKSLMQQVKDGNDPTLIMPKKMEKAVLFCDIRRFTNISEKVDPETLITLLNRYFDIMNEIIITNNGEIDKLIGDCIMAFFESKRDALNAAVQMRRELPRIQEVIQLRYDVLLETGIGITFGEVVVGNIGSKSKMDFTLIGDTVNASSRLESLTKEYGTPILVSDAFVHELQEVPHRFVDQVKVKGKDEPITLYEVFDGLDENKLNLINKLQPDYEHAFLQYSTNDFNESLLKYTKLTAELNKMGIQDALIKFYIERLKDLVENEHVRKQKYGSVWKWESK